MAALDALAAWPVDHAAGAVVDGRGVRETEGDTGWVTALASVTKPLFALACLVAVEEGTLALDAPAGPPGATVRHLLAHASGLPFEGATPVAPPGRRRIYSNTGFDLLGDTLATASGMPVTAYLREAVLDPLGMGATELRGSPAKDAFSSIDDLVRLAGELLAPTLVAPGDAGRGDRRAVPRPGRDRAGAGPLRPQPLGPGVRAQGDQGAPLDGAGRLAPHVRALRRGGHVPVGRPRRGRGVRGADRP